ncbi:hypothetical protein CVT26_003599 [Gymnopilus dilepis]|uniref:Uncharacterized protein n=1 Tax=Gymnopilus dilepis TaxID=231916 RepID=A0A409W1V2_9AGAR|nr:hypothetical protein CVT26_003599 [Gymnopilus dilepis]
MHHNFPFNKTNILSQHPFGAGTRDLIPFSPNSVDFDLSSSESIGNFPPQRSFVSGPYSQHSPRSQPMAYGGVAEAHRPSGHFQLVNEHTCNDMYQNHQSLPSFAPTYSNAAVPIHASSHGVDAQNLSGFDMASFQSPPSAPQLGDLGHAFQPGSTSAGIYNQPVSVTPQWHGSFYPSQVTTQTRQTNAATEFHPREYSEHCSVLEDVREPETIHKPICRQEMTASQGTGSQTWSVERDSYPGQDLTASYPAIQSPGWSSSCTSLSSGSEPILEAFPEYDLHSPSPLFEDDDDDEDDEDYEDHDTPPPSPPAGANAHSQFEWSSHPGAAAGPTWYREHKLSQERRRMEQEAPPSFPPQPPKPVKEAHWKLESVYQKEIYRGQQFIHVNFDLVYVSETTTFIHENPGGH